MIRFAIAPIIGTGTLQDAFRSAFDSLNQPGQPERVLNSLPILTDNVGHPVYRFCFGKIAFLDYPLIAAVSNAYIFPDYNLDGRMDGMESEARTGLVQSVTAYDFDGVGRHVDVSHEDSDSYRFLLNKIGLQLNPVFDVDRLSVAEVAG